MDGHYGALRIMPDIVFEIIWGLWAILAAGLFFFLFLFVLCMVLIAVCPPLGRCFVFVVVGVGFVVFYGTPVFAPLCIYWAWTYDSMSIFDEPAFSGGPSSVTPFVIWFIAWFPTIYFLHFKDKKQTPTIAEMNPKLPTPPPDLWKN